MEIIKVLFLVQLGIGNSKQSWLIVEQTEFLLGVIKENKKGHTFWKSLGFIHYNTVISKNQKENFCYEKILH
jgi:hypothetical protein